MKGSHGCCHILLLLPRWYPSGLILKKKKKLHKTSDYLKNSQSKAKVLHRWLRQTFDKTDKIKSFTLILRIFYDKFEIWLLRSKKIRVTPRRSSCAEHTIKDQRELQTCQERNNGLIVSCLGEKKKHKVKENAGELKWDSNFTKEQRQLTLK